jgi:ribosomal protein S18 acetylase RimI-like enzyme
MSLLTSSMRLRPATPDDADELARLRWTFRVEHGTSVDRAFEEFLDEFRGFAKEVLADGSAWWAWVAQRGDRLVGCLWLQLVEKVPHPSRRRWERPIGYVTNVYVEPDLRNEGIGARLMDEVLAFAREREVAEVVVWPSARSVSFYRRAGFGSEQAPLLLDLAGD